MESAFHLNHMDDHDGISTPDASLFLPSPSVQMPSTTITCTKKSRSNESSISHVTPSVQKHAEGYFGLRLERFVIHYTRYEGSGDSSILEAIVESAYDDFKSVRVAADGSESVHSFVSALADEFLNAAASVRVTSVTVTSRENDGGAYACTVETVYPAIPQFKHLARKYVGTAVSSRSVLHASLSAACSAIGQILLTFQPEGFELPQPPLDSPMQKYLSPMPSTIDSPHGSLEPSNTSSIDVLAYIREPMVASSSSVEPTPSRSKLSRWFVCGK